MSIKIGGSDPSAIYVGGTPISEVYMGSTKIWPSGSPPAQTAFKHWKINIYSLWSGGGPAAGGWFAILNLVFVDSDDNVISGSGVLINADPDDVDYPASSLLQPFNNGKGAGVYLDEDIWAPEGDPTPNNPAWATFEFQSAVEIAAIHFAYPTWASDNIPRDIEVFGSDDGSNWTSLGTFEVPYSDQDDGGVMPDWPFVDPPVTLIPGTYAVPPDGYS